MEHLAAADACILPHDYGVQLNHRGFAAAAVQGLPTIAVRGRIPEALLRDGEHLLLCPPGKPEALAEAVSALMGSIELRERLGRGAQNLARACYLWDSAAPIGSRPWPLESGRRRASRPDRPAHAVWLARWRGTREVSQRFRSTSVATSSYRGGVLTRCSRWPSLSPRSSAESATAAFPKVWCRTECRSS